MKTASFSLAPGALLLTGSALFLLVAAILYWPAPEVAFRTDDSPAAWLSSAQLWAAAVLALRLWRERALPAALSLWLCAALMEMAFDEQFMLHEHWKYGCAQWFDACRHAWVTELPMLLVGILGLATVLWLQRGLPTRGARILLWLALGVGLFALVLRFTGRPEGLLAYKAAFLVLAEALFVGTLLGIAGPQVHSA
jgi:hypothetical protein